MATPEFTLFELLLGMLLFFICGYLVHWEQTQVKEKEVKNGKRIQ